MKTWLVITGSWHILLPCQWHGATEWQRVIDLNYSVQAKVKSAANESGRRKKTNWIQKHAWTWSLCVWINITHIEITDEAIRKKGQNDQGCHYKCEDFLLLLLFTRIRTITYSHQENTKKHSGHWHTLTKPTDFTRLRAKHSYCEG